MDYIKVRFLVMIFYCNYTRCYHWGKVGQGYTGSLYYFLQLFLNLYLSQKKVKHIYSLKDCQETNKLNFLEIMYLNEKLEAQQYGIQTGKRRKGAPSAYLSGKKELPKTWT